MRADKLQDNYTTWGGGGVDGEERTIASTSQMRKLMGGVSKQKKGRRALRKQEGVKLAVLWQVLTNETAFTFTSRPRRAPSFVFFRPSPLTPDVSFFPLDSFYDRASKCRRCSILVCTLVPATFVKFCQHLLAALRGV